jgi:hypothetical protein
MYLHTKRKNNQKDKNSVGRGKLFAYLEILSSNMNENIHIKTKHGMLAICLKATICNKTKR